MSTNAKTFVKFLPGRLFRTGRLLNFFKNSTLDVYLDRTLIKFPTIIPPGRLFPPTLLLGRLEYMNNEKNRIIFIYFIFFLHIFIL